MPLKDSRRSTGVITIHTSPPSCLFKSAVPRGVEKNGYTPSSESRKTPYVRVDRARNVGAEGRRKEAWVMGPPQGPWVDWLSHTSLRQLQAKLKAENEDAMAITQTLLDTENGFVKDMERFLYLREMAELRRKELLHKRWTEHVWVPIQRTVDEHVSNWQYKHSESIRSMLKNYICHCNLKGYVFLDEYNLQEYNPFLLHINSRQNFKVTTPALMDPMFLQSSERQKEKRVIMRCQTGHPYKWKQMKELLPHSASPFDPMTPQSQLKQADFPLKAQLTQ